MVENNQDDNKNNIGERIKVSQLMLEKFFPRNCCMFIHFNQFVYLTILRKFNNILGKACITNRYLNRDCYINYNFMAC